MKLHKPEFTHDEQIRFGGLGSMVNPFLWVKETRGGKNVIFSIQACCYTFRVRFNGEIVAEPYRDEGMDVAIEAIRNGIQKNHALIAKARELLNPQNEVHDFTTEDGWKAFRSKQAEHEWAIYKTLQTEFP